MKRRHIVGLVVIVAFIAYSFIAFQSSLTPYVSFAQAKSSTGAVQVRGVLANEKITVTENGKTIMFLLRDEAGEEVPVIYQGTKPEGLSQATSIVAVGKFQNGQFTAEKLLIKCPSKYQGSVKPS
ncbi:cytochrome c maturation protein CcmE [Sporomusa acidovorans]|uniref:Cytochrome c-type biogenesis protein CcmE n=1 Tax=Sporomusa acidovorans (strain ATCC 49682 / DSM 3132 / Mol) TaxID=1123286 RepID=A0ABZ3JAV0_SPOA4|nr:cytochrome c maturation protein CcmE [Sporomusa acidovorans]OZC21791.1 cytochrome c-type biogenesis protein CcmE [Sporomusa acidovorans DSM 3132]SDD56778.1 cytochrome c-type biogenesis protein CcmE [Sporomusa acidovorans]